MKIYVIAEAGVNHNGDIDQAMALVDAAADTGADAVKFQTFRAEALATSSAPKATYQSARTGFSGGQLSMLKALELSPDDHRLLQDRATTRGIHFLSTPFDHESLLFLIKDLGLKTIKLGSGEVTNGPLLVATGRTGCNVILSTGMSTEKEVGEALGALSFGYREATAMPSRSIFRNLVGAGPIPSDIAKRVTLLHCTTAYPAPAAHSNLRAMQTMARKFGVRVGLSDHTKGIATAVAAAALGATTIEKHLTLDQSLPGPDQAASLEPDEFTTLVREIRIVEAARNNGEALTETLIYQATTLGDGQKRPMPSEMENKVVARKSLIALAPLRRGDAFNEKCLGVKRPGNGISPMEYWQWLGRTAARDYAADELITADQ